MASNGHQLQMQPWLCAAASPIVGNSVVAHAGNVRPLPLAWRGIGDAHQRTVQRLLACSHEWTWCIVRRRATKLWACEPCILMVLAPWTHSDIVCVVFVEIWVTLLAARPCK